MDVCGCNIHNLHPSIASRGACTPHASGESRRTFSLHRFNHACNNFVQAKVVVDLLEKNKVVVVATRHFFFRVIYLTFVYVCVETRPAEQEAGTIMAKDESVALYIYY
jgi:hypothetical protein